MFCPKCGGKLPDGSKFCGVCGEKLTGEIPKTLNEPNTSNASVSSENASKPHFVPFRKKIDSKKIACIAISAIVAIVAIFGLKSLFSGHGDDNVYICLSDGKYKLITDISKEEAIEIASSKSDYFGGQMLAFSPDGKYIYYYTKYDSGVASLCRAEYGKLKKDSKKNEKYIEIIATNVKLRFHFMKDGSLVYENNENTLYCYKEKEAIPIAKNIQYYFTDDSERIVYVVGDDSEGYTFYGVVLNDIDNKIKLASDVANIRNITDFDNILYTKYEDGYSETLYVVGFEKKTEKLAEKVNILTWEDGKVYFTTPSGKMLNLYGFVEDPYAESDAKAEPPIADDFSIPVYSYKMVQGSDLSESDFDELYTTCTRDLYWYGESARWSYSMEEAVDRNWGKDTRGIQAATQKFIDKFADTADENGYILVTDEVKAALKEIQKYADDPEQEWQWMWLCYNKYQSNTTTDYDAYNTAKREWNNVTSRNKIRETLKNDGNDYTVRAIYCFDKGNLTKINEDALDIRGCEGGIIFNTVDLVTKTVPIETATVYDVCKLFSLDNEAENYVVLTVDGTLCQMSVSAAEAFGQACHNNYGTLYFFDKVVYLDVNKGALSVAAIEDGVVGDFKIINDDAEFLYVDGSTLYYASDSYWNNSNDKRYCDLYSYDNGSGTCLAKDVIRDNINIYDDGVILAYTGYKSYAGYELSMMNPKGENTLIEEGVTQYIRVDKSTLLYLAYGSLYLYNGEEKNKVQSGVDCFWSKKSMEITHTFD